MRYAGNPARWRVFIIGAWLALIHGHKITAFQPNSLLALRRSALKPIGRSICAVKGDLVVK
jgi:hypothetical protein